MQTAIAEYRTEIVSLCKQFHVRRLELFGSALSDEFDSDGSDLDFLVEFEPLTAVAYAKAFFDFKDALERLSGRPVDLVVPSAIRNSYFRRSVE